MSTVIWKAAPEQHDYPAAASYLALVASPQQVDALALALQQASEQHWKASNAGK